MMMGAARLGSSSLKRMREVGMPITRAAWTNSRSRSESTSPRMSRAVPIQPNTDSTTTRLNFWIVA